MATFHLTLDIDKSALVGQTVRVRTGDRESCVIEADITQDGTPYSLSGMAARFCCIKPDGTFVEDAGCSVSGSTVTHTLGQQAAAAPGLITTAYFELLKGSTVIDSTQDFPIEVLRDAESSPSGESGDYLSEVEQAVQAANAAAAAANGAAEDATAAAQNALNIANSIASIEPPSDDEAQELREENATLATALVELQDGYIVLGETAYMPTNRRTALSSETVTVAQANVSGETATLN